MSYPVIPIARAETLIPRGIHCYAPIAKPAAAGCSIPASRTCPFWSLREGKPAQANGYCSYLKIGDGEEGGTSRLWDRIKECSVAAEPDDDF